MEIEEAVLIATYRQWNTIEHRVRYLVIRYYLLTGSTALTLAFYKRLLNIALVDFKIA